MAKNDDRYTDPELRTQIKEDIQAGDKGGKPGQWSARKAQMMASEYKKQTHERGEEPYTTDKSEQSEGQKHLNEWTKEEWQTSEGNGAAKQDDGTQRRYLPKKAWENMTEEEKEATNEAKLEGGANGKQYVPNTAEAKKARKDAKESQKTDIADEGEAEDDAEKETNDEDERADESPKRGTKHKRDDKEAVEDASEGRKVDEEKGDETVHSHPPAKQAKGDDGEKRATQSHSKGESGDADENEQGDEQADEKSDGEHGQPGSATRLPKEGQNVFWRATPGWCEGSVVELAYEEKNVDGIHVNASKDDPRIVLKSAKSGKTAVHKPEAVYF